MSAHTPGPWEVRGRGHNRADIWQAEHAGNEQIGEVYTGGSNRNNPGHANAQLIAAAPDLHAALFALSNYFEVHTMDTGRTSRGEEVWQAARAALGKAEEHQ
jgi:hypothetical protein